MKTKLARIDPNLKPYQSDLLLRMDRYEQTRAALLGEGTTLSDFANAHHYFGVHPTADGWFYREWAPGAEEMYFTGDFNGWDRKSHPMTKGENGVFEIFLPGKDALKHGQKIGAVVISNGNQYDRIPLYANYVVQNPVTYDWNAEIYAPEKEFSWSDSGFVPSKPLFIYECHIGMAQEEGKVGSYREFADNILPRIHDLGYNTIQVMAIMEHPYYASFGYQVTNMFAASSRFGVPDDLKYLVDRAHAMGIAVLLDVVHSHASKNTREGINEFDGTEYQFFHAGPRGNHSAWDTKCFNYGKHEVLHFLLSNLKYWLTEYHFDGFRFDGITSMLYLDHGLGTSFDCNEKYFSMNTDLEAVTYLQLANDLVRELDPNAIMIAEDMSAMPGLCIPVKDGGIGFDYRLAMGEPDMWIRLIKEKRDEDWDLNQIYYELANRRPREKVIGYCESHDQALVGDKTLMFRLCDQEMYWSMGVDNQNSVIHRGMALHKMLRLLTMSLGGEGYLTFMGNEFGHPEWIDFPREGNGWSYHYCRRQWSLSDDPALKYKYLKAFEKDMVALSKSYRIVNGHDSQLLVNNPDHVMAFKKGKATLIFNFDPVRSYEGYLIPVAEEGEYQVILSSDDYCYGGHGRVAHQIYSATIQPNGKPGILIYLPNRTAIVLKKKRSK